MTTRAKLVAQIKRILSGGTTPKDSKLNDDYLSTEVVQVTNGLLKLQWYDTKKEGFNNIGPCATATYENVAVLNDTVRKRNYSVLPAYPVNLPDGTGVQQVKPFTGIPAKDVAMIPIQPNEYELFRSLLVGAEIFKDQFTFEVDRNKVWYTKKYDKTLLESGVSLVEMKIVVYDPSTIADTDPYPIPPEFEMTIIKEVLMLHGYNPAKAELHDMINDENPVTK